MGRGGKTTRARNNTPPPPDTALDRPEQRLRFRLGPAYLSCLCVRAVDVLRPIGGEDSAVGGRGQGIYLCGCESVLGSAFCRGRKDTPEKKLPRFLGGPPLYSLILDVGTRMHLHIKFISFCFCFNLTRLRYLMRAPCFPGHTRGDWGSCEFLYGRSVTFHTRFCWTAPSVCEKQALTHP